MMPSSGGRGGPAAKPADGLAGYELLGEVGRGGMGVVYRARQVKLNRPVALKMVLAGVHAGPAELSRFGAEAEAVARVQHPNIVQIYEVGEHDGRPFLALEFVDGTSLQAAVAGTPQPIRPAAHLVEILARAVHAAHLRGVVHRDLKPGNVLLAKQPEGGSGSLDPEAVQVAAAYGVPKVTDFGLAKRLEDDGNQTRSGDILGTPSYMAPEQAAGRASAAGPGADVYALGAILYELLTGRPPFKGATPIETLHQVIHDDPVPPGRLRPKLPKDLERICLKCLEKDPRRRYTTAAELADDLRRHLLGEPVRARPAGPAERLWRWARRNPAPAGLLVSITVGAAVGFLHLGRLTDTLVEESAVVGAEELTETINELNTYYTGVAGRVKEAARGEGPDAEAAVTRAMPPPATFTIELCQQITQKGQTGMQVRMYSEHPFANRKDRPPLDAFQTSVLRALEADPHQPVIRFEGQGKERVLRYATARLMEEGCVRCHNTHKDRPNRTWKVGEVRGVLEVVRPLAGDQQRIDDGLRGTVLLVGGIGVTLLTLTGALLVLGGKGRRVRFLSSDPGPRPVPETVTAPPGTPCQTHPGRVPEAVLPAEEPDADRPPVEPPPFDTDRGGAGDTLAKPGSRG